MYYLYRDTFDDIRGALSFSFVYGSAKFDACVRGERAFTLRLTDPMANTWVYSPFASAGEADPRLTHETYVRSHQEDVDLGLMDMNAPREDD